MPPKISDDRVLRRELKIYGIENLVVLSITKDGITLKAKGTKLGVTLSWVQLVEACALPNNIPSKFQGRPYEFLKFQAAEHQKKATAKLAKKISEEIEGTR